MMNKKIIIVNARAIHGGTIVLSTLCKCLQERGINARVFYVHKFPSEDTNICKYWYEWFVYFIKYRILSLIYYLFRKTSIVNNSHFIAFNYIPVKGLKEQFLPFFSRNNTIVVYPEIVYGNFLRAKNVVRWLLYHYNWANDMNAYSNDDLFICYRDVFNNKLLNPKGYKVNIAYFDSDLYRQYNFGKREGKCYIIRKGYSRTDLPEVFDGPIIDNLKESEIVDVFNKHKYCYCYDMQTFYASIAAVCGCIPILVPEPGKTKEDYRSEDEIDSPGVAWGDTPEEIEHALNTRQILLKRLDLTECNRKGIDDFLDIIQQSFFLKT